MCGVAKELQARPGKGPVQEVLALGKGGGLLLALFVQGQGGPLSEMCACVGERGAQGMWVSEQCPSSMDRAGQEGTQIGEQQARAERKECPVQRCTRGRGGRVCAAEAKDEANAAVSLWIPE